MSGRTVEDKVPKNSPHYGRTVVTGPTQKTPTRDERGPPSLLVLTVLGRVVLCPENAIPVSPLKVHDPLRGGHPRGNEDDSRKPHQPYYPKSLFLNFKCFLSTVEYRMSITSHSRPKFRFNERHVSSKDNTPPTLSFIFLLIHGGDGRLNGLQEW